MNHLGAKTIDTERLTLRKFIVSDADNMYNNWASDDEVSRYLTWPTHSCIEVTKELLATWEEKAKKDDNYQWCIVLKDTGEAIGSIGVVKMSDMDDTVEIGYCIGKKYWNKGITTEAFRAIIRFLFEDVNVCKIFAGHDVKNPASGKVMQKSGLTFEMLKPQGGKNNTGICDMAIYSLLKKDWLVCNTEDKNEFDSEFSNVKYLAEENIVFLTWKKFCCFDDYRNPTTFALKMLKKFPNSNFVVDAKNGFEDERDDVEWGFSVLLPAMSKTECKIVIFIMNEVNEIEEEMDMWTKEFMKYFTVKKVKSYDDAIKFIMSYK